MWFLQKLCVNAEEPRLTSKTLYFAINKTTQFWNVRLETKALKDLLNFVSILKLEWFESFKKCGTSVEKGVSLFFSISTITTMASLIVTQCVPAALAASEERARVPPAGYTGSSPSRSQKPRRWRCGGPTWRGSAPPWPPTVTPGPATERPAPSGQAGSGRTWRHGWRDPTGRSSGPLRRWRTCPCGCEPDVVDALSPSPRQRGPDPAEDLENDHRESIAKCGSRIYVCLWDLFLWNLRQMS